MMDEDSSQDPLGARDSVVYVEDLTRWNVTALPLMAEEKKDKAETVEEKASPFPWRNDLNKKVNLW